jgi:hypothetical protein
VPATPAGWTLGWFDEFPNARQRLYYKVAGSAEPLSLDLAAGSSNVNAARIYSFSGVTASALFAEGATTSSDADGTLPGPTLTTTGAPRLAVAFVALDMNALMSPFDGEIGGDWVEAVPEYATSIGSNFGLGLQIATLTAPGTISGGEADFGGGGDSSICRAFALIGN